MAPPTPTKTGDRALGALAYWAVLVIVPLVVRNKSRFLRYHTRQAMYLFASAIAVLAVTLGILFAFDRTTGRESPPFLVFSVILLLEMVAYGITVVALTVQSFRGRMPMLPLLGDLAGEG